MTREEGGPDRPETIPELPPRLGEAQRTSCIRLAAAASVVNGPRGKSGADALSGRGTDKRILGPQIPAATQEDRSADPGVAQHVCQNGVAEAAPVEPGGGEGQAGHRAYQPSLVKGTEGGRR